MNVLPGSSIFPDSCIKDKLPSIQTYGIFQGPAKIFKNLFFNADFLNFDRANPRDMKFSFTKVFRQNIKWNIVFLALVIFTVFFIPVFPPKPQKILYDLSFTCIFFLGYITSNRQHPVFLPLAISALVLIWISAVFRMPLLFIFSISLNILFFMIVTWSLIRHLIDSKFVTIRIIFDAIIIYLMIGLIFAMIVSMIDHFDPAAFRYPVEGGVTPVFHFNDFIYFTFTTLSTTGFGDIIPLKPYTRSLSILIAITGQMYIAIIISMLVGKYAASAQEERREE
jgi:voltage-gated potassium channel